MKTILTLACVNVVLACAEAIGLFIDVVEAGKFPTAFGLFKHKADRRVFLVVRRLLERAVDFISTGFFFRFGVSKTLGGVRLAIENFIITTQEIRFGFHRFYPVLHRQRKFRHLRDGRLVAGDDSGFKLVPERGKIGLGKRVWKNEENQNRA